MQAISIISGTNRPGNLSFEVAKHYLNALRGQNRLAEVYNLEDLPREFGAADLYSPTTPHFEPFQKMVDQHENFIFIVPEYNGSLPGILKLFIDACAYPRSFSGKRAALVGISAGANGNRTGLSHLEDILNFLGTEVLPEKVYAGKMREKLNESGNIIDEKLKQDLFKQIEDLTSFMS